MGVDCLIYIPSDARLDDIVSVMGAAAGCPWEKRPFTQGDGWSVHVNNIKLEAGKDSFLAGCPTIHINHRTADGDEGHYVMFHYEASDQHGKYRLLVPRSTPFWLAMGDRLTTFFGGFVDANDCDTVKRDWEHKKPRLWNDPSDGKPWYALQEAITKVKPITVDDLNNFRKLAAYDIPVPSGSPVKARGNKKPAVKIDVEAFVETMMKEEA